MFGRALLSRFIISAALVGVAYAGFAVTLPHKLPGSPAESALLFAGSSFSQVRAPLSGGRAAPLAADLLDPATAAPLKPLQDRPVASLGTGVLR